MNHSKWKKKKYSFIYFSLCSKMSCVCSASNHMHPLWKLCSSARCMQFYFWITTYIINRADCASLFHRMRCWWFRRQRQCVVAHAISQQVVWR